MPGGLGPLDLITEILNYKKKVIERVDKDTKKDVFMYVKVALDSYYNQKIWGLDRDRYKVVAQLVTEAVTDMVTQGKVKHRIEISHAVVGLVLREILPPPPPPPHPRPPPSSPLRCAAIWASPCDSPYEDE